MYIATIKVSSFMSCSFARPINKVLRDFETKRSFTFSNTHGETKGNRRKATFSQKIVDIKKESVNRARKKTLLDHRYYVPS